MFLRLLPKLLLPSPHDGDISAPAAYNAPATYNAAVALHALMFDDGAAKARQQTCVLAADDLKILCFCVENDFAVSLDPLVRLSLGRQCTSAQAH